MSNSLFSFLDWILKNKKNPPIFPENTQFIANRWLSMASKPIAQIVNSTTNRWKMDDIEFYSKFHRIVLPKHGKRIEYIKKIPKDEVEDENLENLANLLQISKREMKYMNETLEELNKTSK